MIGLAMFSLYCHHDMLCFMFCEMLLIFQLIHSPDRVAEVLESQHLQFFTLCS